MERVHQFKTTVVWTGNKGVGTKDSGAYGREHTVTIENKPDILCSTDPAWRGDKKKHNPEDFLVSALSSCHMLWYLHICADAGITITDYNDNAIGVLQELEKGGGHFTEVVLNPVVTITDASQIELANSLHKKANEKCFIANSCNFPVKHIPLCKIAE